MKTKQTEFVRKVKAIKRWLELKGVIEQLGITKEDLENNSPFVVIHFVQDYLDRYGITENQFCEMLDNFAKVGFAKSGIFMYHPTNEKFVVMKVNSKCVLNDAKKNETLNELNKLVRSKHGIR